jgi:hypothetical protein
MDLLKMIADLRSERAAIDDALLVLEKLASSHRGQRRGRPPAWMTAQIAAASVRAKRTRVLSAEVKQKMAESQRKRWEAYRKAKGQG